MIALGLAIELVAAGLVVVGVVMEGDGTMVLWASVAVVLAGLLVTLAGVRRARPPWPAWTTAAGPDTR